MPYTYTNTRVSIGEQETLDRLVAHTLTSFTDDAVATLGQYAFYNQTQMEEIHLPNVTTIMANAFLGCSGMKRFFIGMNKDSVVTLSHSNAFTSAGRSIIYVPDSLVNDYRTGSAWKGLSGRIFGYSDLNKYDWDETEISDSWTGIAAKVNAGTAANTYHLGQYKSIDLGTEGVINFQIIGINTDELADGTGTAQLTWFPMSLLNTEHRMNPALDGTTEGTGSIGGWDKCEMKTYLLNTIWPLIPETIRNIIKSVKKYTQIMNASGTTENNVMTSETLFLLSSREVHSNTTNETIGPVYTIAFAEERNKYRNKTTSGGSTTSTSIWWLRTRYNSDSWMQIRNSGTFENAEKDRGVAFGFCT